MTDKATPTLRQRCDTALQCLPDAPYKTMLAVLFDDMTAEVERLAAQSAPAETSAVVSAPKFTRLKFFRDLSNDERMRMLRVFMDLSTIPDDAIKTHGVQRQLFDRVFAVAQSAQAPAQAVQEARCACNDRPASECPGEWEPGCDLGNNPKYVRAYVDAGRTIPPSGEIGGA